MNLPSSEELDAEILGRLEEALPDLPLPDPGEPHLVHDFLTRLFGVLNVALETGRPMLEIRGGNLAPPTGIWANVLGPQTAAARQLAGVAQSVGKLTVRERDGVHKSVGTAWLVRPTLAVTNRHVSERRFARRLDGGTTARLMRALDGADLEVTLDFRESPDATPAAIMRVTEIPYLAQPDGPDLALLRVQRVAGNAPAPLGVTPTTSLAARHPIAVVGFPLGDPDDHVDDLLLAQRPGTKRISPGEIVTSHSGSFDHDCSTTQNSSGSPVVDLETGGVIGIHWGGDWLLSGTGLRAINYAVHAAALAEILTNGVT